MEYKSHYSVMKKEVMELLSQNFKKEDVHSFSDLTFGAGGHSVSILKEYINSTLLAFDQDLDAYNNGLERIEKESLAARLKLVNRNFCELKDETPEVQQFDAVLLDAGVSSHQFDSGERGFSFRFEGPLDMRMDTSRGMTAEEIVNEWSESQLLDLIKSYGEEKFVRNIVRNIIKRRSEERIKTTKDLEDICFHAYPKNMRHGKIHPATKTFQALRIEVNKELDVLADVIGQVIPRLKINGIFMIISFHSLEDRIVKHTFKEWKNNDYPIEILTKKPILPSSEEIFENSRSRSAKLRVLRRVEKWPSKNKYSS